MTTADDSIRTLSSQSFLLFSHGEFTHSANRYRDIIYRLEHEAVEMSDTEKAEMYNYSGLSLKRSGNRSFGQTDVPQSQ